MGVVLICVYLINAGLCSVGAVLICVYLINAGLCSVENGDGWGCSSVFI